MWKIRTIRKETRKTVWNKFVSAVCVAFVFLAFMNIVKFFTAVTHDITEQPNGIMFIFKTDGVKQKNLAYDLYILDCRENCQRIYVEEGFEYEPSELGSKLTKLKEKRFKHEAEIEYFTRDDGDEYIEQNYELSSSYRKGFPKTIIWRMIPINRSVVGEIGKLLLRLLFLVLVLIVGLGKDWFYLGVVRRDEQSMWSSAEDLTYDGRGIGIYLLAHIKVFLWSLLLIVPGILKDLDYLMVPYILRDNPRFTAKETFQKSTEMMKGNRGRAFLLGLSYLWLAIPFIPLYVAVSWYFNETVTVLFSVVCLALFVFPYTNTVYAQLYEELKKKENETVSTEV